MVQRTRPLDAEGVPDDPSNFDADDHRVIWGLLTRGGHVAMKRNPKLTSLHAGIDAFAKTDPKGQKLMELYQLLARSAVAPEWPDDEPDDNSGDAETAADGVQKSVWTQIEHEADSIVAKSNAPMSRAKAIVKAMGRRPDLVAKYYAR